MGRRAAVSGGRSWKRKQQAYSMETVEEGVGAGIDVQNERRSL